MEIREWINKGGYTLIVDSIEAQKILEQIKQAKKDDDDTITIQVENNW